MSLVIIQIVTTKIGDWTISVHSRHGSKDYDRKHVHISKRGLKGEYSWNIDGTRHDEHRFPNSEQCIQKAKNHAANALGIPINSLQFLTRFDGSTFVSLKNHDDPGNGSKSFNSYIHKGKFLIALGSEKGLVIVVDYI